MVTDIEIGEIASGLGAIVTEADFEEMSFACRLEAMTQANDRSALEFLAAKAGLGPTQITKILYEPARRAEILARAYTVFKQLAEYRHRQASTNPATS